MENTILPCFSTFYIAPSYPFAMFGPGNDTPHQVNEYVDEKMYLNFVKIYTELFVAYLNK